MSEPVTDTVDVAFDVAGVSVPDDYSFAVMREVARCLPWLESEPDVGIHPLRGARTDYGVTLLPRRAKLTLRLRRQRVADALPLCGQALDVEGCTLRVGSGSARPLRPYGALYSRLVITECSEEEGFLEDVTARLATLAAKCTPVCGRRRCVRTSEGEIVGFGLMLHELTPEHSLLLQRAGIGAERKLGCGIFVPHRLASAVGSA